MAAPEDSLSLLIGAKPLYDLRGSAGRELVDPCRRVGGYSSIDYYPPYPFLEHDAINRVPRFGNIPKTLTAEGLVALPRQVSSPVTALLLTYNTDQVSNPSNASRPVPLTALVLCEHASSRTPRVAFPHLYSFCLLI